MTRNNINKILIPVMVLLTVNQALTAMLANKMSHETFEYLHQGGGAIFLLLIACHFIMNFNWVKASYFSKRHGT